MKPGDVVKAKAGGPKMTVEAVLGVQSKCIWFDKNDELHAAQFDNQLLEVDQYSV